MVEGELPFQAWAAMSTGEKPLSPTLAPKINSFNGNLY